MYCEPPDSGEKCSRGLNDKTSMSDARPRSRRVPLGSVKQRKKSNNEKHQLTPHALHARIIIEIPSQEEQKCPKEEAANQCVH